MKQFKKPTLQMKMSKEMTAVNSLIKIIKRFKFNEIESAVLPYFPEITWSKIKKKLIATHASFTIGNVVNIIQYAIAKANLPEKTIKERFYTLQTVEVSRHSNRKTWYGYSLIGPKTNDQVITSQEIECQISGYIRNLKDKIEVKVIAYNNITFISFKNAKSKSMLSQPVYFALFLDQKYFFCSRKSVLKEYIDVITFGLNFSKNKPSNLFGKDLKSLIRIVRAKQQGTLHLNNIEKDVIYSDAEPLIQQSGINFDQYHMREKYAQKFFGPDTPTLESLVVNGPDESWELEELDLVLPDVATSVEFRSHNIGTLFTKLAAKRVLATPFPQYIQQFMTSGKNRISLKNK